MEQTEYSNMLAYELQMLENHPEDCMTFGIHYYGMIVCYTLSGRAAT
jgi:hypothetical protein